MCDLPWVPSELDSEEDEETDEVGTKVGDDTDGLGMRGGSQRRSGRKDVTYSAITSMIELKARPPKDAAQHAVTRLAGGPARGSRVAVIGAGPAGVHISYLLRRVGCRVVIYERSSRIGGKSLTVLHRGAWHDLGTCYLSQDFDAVQQLLTEFDVCDQVRVKPRVHERPLMLYSW